jgi:hypothetical protein
MAGYIIEIELPYESNKIIKSWSPEDYAEFRKKFKDFDMPETSDQMADYMTYTMFGSEADFWDLVSLSLKPMVRRIRGMPCDALPEVAKVPGSKEAQTLIVNVSVPNAALFAVQSITWVEDACTQHIQSMLNTGWRIVAVIPANDCRRPTYIMGHPDAGC